MMLDLAQETLQRLTRRFNTDHRDDGHHGEIFQHARTTAAGTPKRYIPPASAFTAFGGGGGTWTFTPGTASIVIYYTRLGSPEDGALWITFEIEDTTTSAAPTQLRLTLPEQLVATRFARAAVRIKDNGTLQTVSGWAIASTNNPFLSLQRDGAANAFSAGTNNMSVQGELLCWVREANR